MTGGNFESDRDDFDSQDQSETLDEANTVGNGDQGEVRTFAAADARGTFEEMPDVADLLQAEGPEADGDAQDDALDYRLQHESDAKGG